MDSSRTAALEAISREFEPTVVVGLVDAPWIERQRRTESEIEYGLEEPETGPVGTGKTGYPRDLQRFDRALVFRSYASAAVRVGLEYRDETVSSWRDRFRIGWHRRPFDRDREFCREEGSFGQPQDPLTVL